MPSSEHKTTITFDPDRRKEAMQRWNGSFSSLIDQLLEVYIVSVDNDDDLVKAIDDINQDVERLQDRLEALKDISH